MKLKVCATIFLCLACWTASSGQQPGQRIEDLGWLKGCWASNIGGREVEEYWTKPAGKTMLSLSRTVAQGKTIAFEYVRLVQEEDGNIYYVAKPSGQTEARFKLLRSAANEAVFENPEHDFPQRIIYRLEKDDSLFARIEGVSRGKERGINFPMKRIECD